MSKKDKNQIDPALIEYNKGVSRYKTAGKISECFYHKKEECRGAIKQAHSLQRNGRLSIIEGDVNGTSKIYTFGEPIPSKKAFFSDLKPIGKAKASTFFGFCDHHDTTLFSPIENHKYNGSDEHIFLHSYRSFAHTYHTRKEALKARKSQSGSKLPSDFATIVGFEFSMKDAETAKKELDRMIEEKSYSELYFFAYEIPRLHPIACATIVTPPYFYNNEPFNMSIDENDPYSDIMLTVLPDTNSTIIILACFPNDENGIKFIDQIADLSDDKFERAISSIMISSVENTFFSPIMWNALGKQGRKTLLSELEFNVIEHVSADVNHSGFYHSKVNLFSRKLSVPVSDV